MKNSLKKWLQSLQMALVMIFLIPLSIIMCIIVVVFTFTCWSIASLLYWHNFGNPFKIASKAFDAMIAEM